MIGPGEFLSKMVWVLLAVGGLVGLLYGFRQQGYMTGWKAGIEFARSADAATLCLRHNDCHEFKRLHPKDSTDD